MASSEHSSGQLRYERKFLVATHSHKEVEQILKFHPACFSEVFHERRINNIYFDTPGLSNYFDNIDGEKRRLKIRIRWYGETFGNVSSPVLEFKIKEGLLGKKVSYNLNTFELKNEFDKSLIERSLKADKVPDHVLKQVLSLNPTLLNSYTRKYFLSADKKFRITIDKNLEFFSIKYGSNTFVNQQKDNRSTVLELKYNAEDEPFAKELTDNLLFPLTKSSKYVQGLDRILR